MKIYVFVLAVLAAGAYFFFVAPSELAESSALECANKQKLAAGGDAAAKDDANRFCRGAAASVGAMQKVVPKL